MKKATKVIRLTDEQYAQLLWVLEDDMRQKIRALESEFGTGPFENNVKHEMKFYLALAKAIRDGTDR